MNLRRYSLEHYVTLLTAGGSVIFLLGYLFNAPYSDFILLAIIIIGGLPLISQIILRVFKGELNADILALVAIITAIITGEYLAGVLIILMLSGGLALEKFAIERASSALMALSERMPQIAHQVIDNEIKDINISDIEVEMHLMIMPHEVVPADGEVLNGYSTMDESFLTGEPYQLSKGPGSTVLAGAINGEGAVSIKVSKSVTDSRYELITQVLRNAERARPKIRRIADRLGALYTPFCLLIATLAAVFSGELNRFLAVCVVATPCPLLIAIPVAIMGAMSLAAQRGIIIKDPAILEEINECSTLIIDKTGTLTLGQPILTKITAFSNYNQEELLQMVASVEQYSRHPLAHPIKERAAHLTKLTVDHLTEKPGFGLVGQIAGKTIQITGRKNITPDLLKSLPESSEGLECLVMIDGELAGIFEFHDTPRKNLAPFFSHLFPHHQIKKTIIASGDRISEVAYLAKGLNITELHANLTPEDKVAIVRKENAISKTIFVGDGINDAPALVSAHVGIAFGLQRGVATEAAGAIILDSSLVKVDELLHISQQLKRIALSSSIGGMTLSIFCIVLAAGGLLPPVAGAIAQELIDILSILNALRASRAPKILSHID
jgi:heavy metal translocating P-type ATPase